MHAYTDTYRRTNNKDREASRQAGQDRAGRDMTVLTNRTDNLAGLEQTDRQTDRQTNK